MRSVDWHTWNPQERATLAFIVEDQRILLIRKLRGLGAGKITGPGGRLEPGESSRDGVCREVLEELGIVITEPIWSGELWFQFTNGYSLAVDVFRTDHYQGEPRESPEAVPLWFHVDAIPFEDMWDDDILWFPHLLAGRPFRGRFVFDDEAMVSHDLQLIRDS